MNNCDDKIDAIAKRSNKSRERKEGKSEESFLMNQLGDHYTNEKYSVNDCKRYRGIGSIDSIVSTRIH